MKFSVRFEGYTEKGRSTKSDNEDDEGHLSHLQAQDPGCERKITLCLGSLPGSRELRGQPSVL